MTNCQLKIFPGDGRLISGKFRNSTVFEGIVHYPESNPVLQIEGTFLDFEPLSGVKVTMREAIQDLEEPVQTGSDQFPAPDAELMLWTDLTWR